MPRRRRGSLMGCSPAPSGDWSLYDGSTDTSADVFASVTSIYPRGVLDVDDSTGIVIYAKSTGGLYAKAFTLDSEGARTYGTEATIDATGIVNAGYRSVSGCVLS